MKAYNMSIEGQFTLEEQLAKISQYEIADLLFVLRAIESKEYRFDEQVIKKIYSQLYEKGIYCI